MKELKAESSTQKLYWDSEEKIVWGELIGNFFMGLNKPISPSRLFTDTHKAIQRLQTFSDD